MTRISKITASIVLFALSILLVAPTGVSAAEKKAEDNSSEYSVTIDVSKEPYNVKDGDDCTTAVQKALDEATAKGTSTKPGLVKIPKGTYYISRNLIIGSNTTLSLDKKTVIRKSDSRRFPRMLRTPEETADTPKGFDAYSNITISGGTWDNEYKVTEADPSTSGSIFFMVHVTGLTIKNVTACNIYGTHIFEFGAVKDVTVSGCTLYGFKADSELIEKEAIQLDVTHDDQILPSGGPFDDTPCENVTITGCEIYDYPRAVGSHIAIDGIYHKNIAITKNNFHDLSGAAVYGYNYIGMTVKDNKMNNVGSGVIMRNCAMGGADSYYDRLEGIKASKVKNNDFAMVISGNTILTNATTEVGDGADDAESETSAGDAKGIMIYATKDRPICNVTISKNKITATSTGIFLYYVQKSNVSGNTVLRNKGAKDVITTSYTEDGLKINECTTIEISKNKISPDKGTGFENGIAIRGGKSNTITGNTVSEAAKNGIAIYGGKVTGSSNTVTGSAKNGVTVSMAGTLTLSKGDKISKVTQHGISVTEKSTVKATGTVVSDCGGMGVYGGDNTKLTLDSMTVSNTGSHGICICSGNSSINKCSITGAGGNGVTVTEKASVSLKGKTEIKKAKQSGVSVTASKVVISNSSIMNNGKYGIGVYEGATAQLSGVSIGDSTEYGVYAGAGTTVTMSNKCEIRATGKDGVMIEGKKHIDCDKKQMAKDGAVFEMTGSKITGAMKKGICLKGCVNASLTDSQVVDCKNDHGIYMTDSDTYLTVIDCAVSRNGSFGTISKSGILAENQCHLKVRDSIFEANSNYGISAKNADTDITYDNTFLDNGASKQYIY